MNIDAIVFTSNTGYTEQYAKMLAAKAGLPFYTLESAKKSLPKGSRIIYLGWLMASMVKGYKKAAGMYDIKAVCGVCLGDTGSQIEAVRNNNSINSDVPVFTVQGGYDADKIKGVYKFMMKALTQALSGKADRTPDEDAMLNLILQGGSFVSEEHLSALWQWFEANCVR